MAKFRWRTTGLIGKAQVRQLAQQVLAGRQSNLVLGEPVERTTRKGHLETYLRFEIQREDVDIERVKDWLMESLQKYYRGNRGPLLFQIDQLDDDAPLVEDSIPADSPPEVVVFDYDNTPDLPYLPPTL